jgi:hypothetical protein
MFGLVLDTLLAFVPVTKPVGLWALGMLIRCWDAAVMQFTASA